MSGAAVSSPLVILGEAAMQVWRRPLLVVPLYLPALLLALLSTIPVTVGAHALAGLASPAAEVAAGNHAELALEMFLALSAAQVTGTPPPREVAVFGLGGVLGAAIAGFGVLAQGAIYTFVAGGVLSGLAGKGESFWSCCRRWFWPMLRVGILGVLVMLLAGSAGAAVLGSIPGTGGSALTAKVLGGVAWLMVVNGLVETARASMVLWDDPSAWRGMGRAFLLLGSSRTGGSALLVWLGLGLAGAAVWSVAAPLVFAVPATMLAGSIALSQLVALANALLKLFRLSAAARLAGISSPIRPSRPLHTGPAEPAGEGATREPSG